MLVVVILLLVVALGAAAYRRSAGVAPRRAAGEGFLFAAAVALVYWIAFVRHGPTPWWEEDRQRRSAPRATSLTLRAPGAVLVPRTANARVA